MNPWGILIGVRPTKLGHILLDRGMSYQQIDQQLEEEVNGLKNENLKMMIGQPYEDLKNNIEQVKEDYNSQEINEEELKQEIINFYNQFQDLINSLEA